MPDLEYKQIDQTRPGLGWSPVHDPRSLNHLMRAVLPTTVEPKPKTWSIPKVWLDQGQTNECVPHGWTHNLIASPRPDSKATFDQGETYAHLIYPKIQAIDPWAGTPHDGTSVLSAAQYLHGLGQFESYKWCTSVEDIRDAVITTGPVPIGIPWLESMFDPKPSGLLTVDGNEAGGHCTLVRGYHPAMRIPGEDYSKRFEVFRVRNSWGRGWGKDGDYLIRVEDLRDLLKTWGEACVAINQKTVHLATLEAAA